MRTTPLSLPHMPMNTPGFDCRAPRILGDWMVSIPAQQCIREGGTEYVYPPTENKAPLDADTSPQPYVEVMPGDPAYKDAVAAAQTRLSLYHDGPPVVTNDLPVSRAAQIAPRYRTAPTSGTSSTARSRRS